MITKSKGGFPLSRNFQVLVYTHVNFTRVNRIVTRYEVLHLNGKIGEVQLLLKPLFYLRM